MANPAASADLAKYGWAGDETVSQAWLDAAWIVLKTGRTVEQRIAEDPALTEAAIYVLCQMALRVLRNPEGREQQMLTDDDTTKSWTLHERVASGMLYVADDELTLLYGGGSSRKAFSVMPG